MIKKITKSNFTQNGFSNALLLFIIALIIIGAAIGIDFAYIAYTEKQNTYPIPTTSPEEVKTQVTAKGTFSKDKYNVILTLNFNLEGGAVFGEFSGDCSGTISGNYDGKDGGLINGKAVGSCNPFFVPVPASANFSGTVNHQQKNIPITGTGSAVGVSGSGSLVLTF